MRKSLWHVVGILLVVSFVILLPLTVLSKEKTAAADQGSAAEGQKIFKKNCNMCHYPDKSDKKIGPGLKGLFQNKMLPDGKTPATVDNVRTQIENGSKKGMPPFKDKLAAADLAQLLAYLKTL
jgi:cytochrome c